MDDEYFTHVLAIDPGTTSSAWLLLHGEHPLKGCCGIEDNNDLLTRLRIRHFEHTTLLAIEQMQSMGMAVGQECLETQYWVGRFVEAWERAGRRTRRLFRGEVKMYLCGSSRAKDSNVRQALIDIFGGKDKAIGTKKSPGPCHELKSHLWSALAIGITACELETDRMIDERKDQP